MKKHVLKFTALLGLLFAIVACDDCDPKDEPEGLIDFNKAQSMQNLYKAEQHEAINLGLNAKYSPNGLRGDIQDNTAVLFTVENIKKYLCYMENQVNEIDLEKYQAIGYTEDDNVLGIRVYF